MSIEPLDPYSEVVDKQRLWTPDWYSWLRDLCTEVNTGGGGGGGGAGGNNTEVQFNNAGVLDGDPEFTFNPTTNRLAFSADDTDGGFRITGYNANAANDNGAHRILDITYRTNGTGTNPSFSNEEAETIDYRGVHGQSTNGGLTTAKKTFFGINVSCSYNAAGQKFVYGQTNVSFGMGDSAVWGGQRIQYAGGPVNGDEGMGYALASQLGQHTTLQQTTISSIPTQSTYFATTTQSITASQDSQTVTVDTTAGAVVGDWVVVGQEVPSGSPNMDAVQIEAIGAGTITGKFYYNHNNGTSIKPALNIFCVSTFQMGQDRILVNHSAASYSTGTVSGTSGAAFVGSGTSWADNMVGGNALNIGAIALENDDYSGSPFGASPNQLKSWHEILQVNSATSLAIWSFSVAGDTSYKGKGPGAGVYKVSPKAKILRIIDVGGNVTGQLICENSTSTWTVGDSVECVICSYPDVSGFQYHIDAWTAGGIYRRFMRIKNQGARKFESGIEIVAEGPVGNGDAASGGADTKAFTNGIAMNGPMDVGLDIRIPHTTTPSAAIRF